MSSQDDSSDIELKSALPKKIVKKIPKSPLDDLLNNKKTTTKLMIIDALTELKSRKGVSLYAIKKHIGEKYNVNTDKINYIIKRNIKAGVEDGTIQQMKGIGASGSFKLVMDKIVKKKPKSKEKKPESANDKDKPKKVTNKETAEKKVKKKEAGEKKIKKKEKPVIKKTEKEAKVAKEKVAKVKESKSAVELKDKKTKVKMAKVKQTPAKKRAAMMKRKSIGSIIKPPKMKPKV